MPRQRIHHGGRTYVFPDDVPERLKRFQEESGLSWSEIARRFGTYCNTVSRWKEGGGRPNAHHMMALLELAESLGFGCHRAWEPYSGSWRRQTAMATQAGV